MSKRKLKKILKNKEFDQYAILHKPKHNIQTFLQQAYLDLGDTSLIQVKNTLIEPYRDLEYADNPLVEIFNYMRQPEHFSYTCKHLLNVDLLPFQQLILQCLWNYKFPMLIGARGSSKCIIGKSLIITNNGIKRIDELTLQDTEILGENGFSKIKYFWNNGFSNTKKIKTRCGYELEGTLNHPIRIIRNGKIVWSNLEDVCVGDYTIIERKQNWNYQTNNITNDEGYFLGLLIGDGGYTVRGRISFTTNDEFLASEVIRISGNLFSKTFKKLKQKYQYYLHSVEVWDKLFQYYGFNSSVCGEKDIPKCIYNASKSVVANFIRGLMDTDGCCCEHGVSYTSKSINLVKHLQILLTRFGVSSRYKPRLNKKYNRYYYTLYISGDSLRTFNKEIGFKLSRKQQRLNDLAQKNYNTNIEIIPKELVFDLIVKLRNKLKNIVSLGKRKCKKYKIISVYRLKLYDLSYNTLKKIIDLFSVLGDDEDLKKLKEVLNNNYFYDKIIDVQNCSNITYDVCVDNDDHSFISNGFISHNSFLLAIYSLLRAFFKQGCNIVLIGASFRQSKIIFEYIERIWRNSDFLQSIYQPKNRLENGPLHQSDRFIFNLGRSRIIAVALGDGSTIRGLRANYLLTDEYQSISKEIFETVVRGFTSVSSDPQIRTKKFAEIKALRESGQAEAAAILESGLDSGNQIVLSGTTDYIFNPFYQYFKRYKAFIETQGDLKKLQESIGTEIPEGFNHKDYCILRIPYQCLPKGFLDLDMVAQGKATMDRSSFIREFGVGWPKDSQGFFKRSVVEQCTCRPIVMVGAREVSSYGKLKGDPKLKYVIGVDPASESDNLAIVILELNDDPIYRKIVYCWAINRKRLRERLERTGRPTDVNFYSYCTRKIRDLSYKFQTEHIGIDAMGGGIQILESLHDPVQLETGEQKYWPYIRQGDNDIFWWEKPDKPTDGENGIHNLHMVQFANSDWLREANHGMRFDLENKLLIFPCYDALTSVSLDLEKTNEDGDALEDVYLEIEEMKNEISSIVHTQTDSGRDHWDTPSIKLPGNKKGRLRKDRYTALLIANEIARLMTKEEIGQIHYKSVGGYVGDSSRLERKPSTNVGQLYVGPTHITSQITGTYGMGVSRYGR